MRFAARAPPARGARRTPSVERSLFASGRTSEGIGSESWKKLQEADDAEPERLEAILWSHAGHGRADERSFGGSRRRDYLRSGVDRFSAMTSIARRAARAEMARERRCVLQQRLTNSPSRPDVRQKLLHPWLRRAVRTDPADGRGYDAARGRDEER